MLMAYIPWYKRFGIRLASQLMTPPLANMELLDLPKESILHYVSNNSLVIGPLASEFIFRNITKPIMMDHVIEAGDELGNPRKLPINAQAIIRQYHLKNRRYKIMRSLESSARDPNTLVVYNYSMILSLYKYVRSFYSEYYKWWNTQAAMWKKIGEITKESSRQHFIICNLPIVLPSIPDLRLGSASITQKTVKIFNNAESLTILELWKWFGADRKNSVISHIPDSGLDKVNIIFQESGKWYCMNLGKLNSWRSATEDELKIDPNANTKGLASDQIQRRFLRLLVSTIQLRSNVNPQIQETNRDIKEKKAETTTTVIKQDVGVPTINKETGSVELKSKTEVMPIEAQYDDLDNQTPDTTGDTITHDDLLDKALDADLAHLETISNNHHDVQPDEDDVQLDTELPEEPVTLEDGVIKVCDRLAEHGLISAAEYKKYTELSNSYKKIISPDGVTTLDKFIKIDSAILKIDESPVIAEIDTVIDKSMLRTSLLAFDKNYISKVLNKDVAGMVTSIQRAGIAVTEYDVEKVTSVLGDYETHTVKIVPVEGTSSTLRFKLPKISEDGVFESNGIKYRLRKQRGDIPIRKIAPDTVSLTSYYGKTFVTRSNKRVNDYGTWLSSEIMNLGLDSENKTVTNLYPNDVFDNEFKSPRVFSILAMHFRGFTIQPYAYPRTIGNTSFDLNFDHTKRESLYGKEALEIYEKDGAIIIGANINKTYLILDRNNTLYANSKDGNLVPYGTIESILNLESEKAPVDIAELKVMGHPIPLGIVLGYDLGLDKLMALLGVTPRRIPAGGRTNLAYDEYAVVFSDETLIFSKDDKKASLILAGFNDYHNSIKRFSVYEFNKRSVYLNILESKKTTARYLNEINLMYQMFIDTITHDILVEMKEPTDFRSLLIRSCEMLVTDTHPHELDPSSMRIKGYERIAGAVYSEIIKSIRAHNGRPGKSKIPVEMNPYAVWKTISQDPSMSIVNEINPIQNLKEFEAVTYNGVGGRNSRSMVKHTRAYHKNDIGTISEATVDSGDVAINVFTSADPQFTSLRGMSRKFDKTKNGATSVLSTSALLAVGSDVEEGKRVNFISIQNSHSIACDGYHQMPVRTGYEQVIPHRTTDLFAAIAKKPGKVTSITETGIIIEYDDKETIGYEIGRRFGNAEGLTIPHNVISELKEGQKIKVGDVICYNDGYFEKDILNPNQIVLKLSALVKVALMESVDTLDDSSAISKRASNLLKTKTTKVKQVVVAFDQSVKKLVKVGDAVDSESILCIIEDAVTANSNLFDEESLDTLKVMSAQTPQAKVKGIIERIEVYYHGDKEDMSDSLKTIVSAYDRELSKKYKSINREGFNGSVDDGYRVDGDPLSLDTLAIKIYITSEVSAGTGDKNVFANQMKSVIGRILPDDITTESGKQIDAIFGANSIANRVVASPYVIGTTNTLLKLFSDLAVKAYKGK